MGLDSLLERDRLKFSISAIVSELFYDNRGFKVSQQNGELYHFKLGFMNVDKYCRFLKLDFLEIPDKYVEICGVPDRIECKNSVCYVSELKTTFSNKLDFVKKVGYAQLQLYMFVTGIEQGKLYIYLKDRNELLDFVHTYDEAFVKQLIKEYLEIVSKKRNLRNN